jgi:hypothetical protein
MNFQKTKSEINLEMNNEIEMVKENLEVQRDYPKSEEIEEDLEFQQMLNKFKIVEYLMKLETD